ncbi:MAG: hypothetical protein ACR2G6_03695 [Gemmatimonadaceae bacterium]
MRRGRREGILVLQADVHAQPLIALGRSDRLDEIGEDNVLGNIDDALNQARMHLGLKAVAPPSVAMPTVARETPAAGVTSVNDE